MKNRFDWVYVEVLPKHTELIELFQDHGFERIGKTKRDEERLAKPIIFIENRTDENVIEFNQRNSPTRVRIHNVQKIVVPIIPLYHEILFPDQQQQSTMFPHRNPFGNSIRKAYLCNASIRDLNAGDLLFFYRSEDMQAITSIGYLEDFMASTDTDKIASFVGRRTVYTFDEINKMASSPVLALLFRQVRILQQPVSLNELLRMNVLKGPPQSLTRFVNQESWVQKLLEV